MSEVRDNKIQIWLAIIAALATVLVAVIENCSFSNEPEISNNINLIIDKIDITSNCDEYLIYGKVLDSNQSKISNVEIKLDNALTYFSDSDGQFLVNIAYKDYYEKKITLNASRVNYKNSSKDVYFTQQCKNKNQTKYIPNSNSNHKVNTTINNSGNIDQINNAEKIEIKKWKN